MLIEPQPQNYNNFLGLRTASLTPWCISDKRETVKFQTFVGTEQHASGLGKEGCSPNDFTRLPKRVVKKNLSQRSCAITAHLYCIMCTR